MIVEDHQYQAELLSGIVNELRPNYKISECVTKVDNAVKYLTHTEPDLIFMDIELENRLCFEIFDQVTITAPVIYSTSHDEFALEAFYKNGIHFLVKPTTHTSVRDGIQKYEQLVNKLNALKNDRDHHKDSHNKFLLNAGKFSVPMDKQEIKYAHLDGRMVFVVTRNDKRFTVDGTLDDVMTRLDSNYFYRINRQFIVHVDFIDRFCSSNGGRIEVKFKEKEIASEYVSFKKRGRFLNWVKGVE